MSEPVNAAPACEPPQQEDLSGPPAANRHRLPDERVGLTHHFSIAGHEGYLTVGLYPNGQPGEIFIRMAKEGSTIAGLMECFGTVVSVSLQHGAPLKVLCDKLSHTRFEPSGWTGNGEHGYAKSIMDYLFRWMELRSLSGKQLLLFTQQTAVVERQVSEEANQATASISQYPRDSYEVGDAPLCVTCGSLMVRNGSCHKCAIVAVRVAARDGGAGSCRRVPLFRALDCHDEKYHRQQPRLPHTEQFPRIPHTISAPAIGQHSCRSCQRRLHWSLEDGSDR